MNDGGYREGGAHMRNPLRKARLRLRHRPQESETTYRFPTTLEILTAANERLAAEQRHRHSLSA